jgi:predicted secreted protein
MFDVMNFFISQETLGHTEDALSENLNNYYFVSAHIISESPEGKYKVTEERFTSLCYAGHLPGYTMNYNHHGLVFSINTLSAAKLNSGKTRKKSKKASAVGKADF